MNGSELENLFSRSFERALLAGSRTILLRWTMSSRKSFRSSESISTLLWGKSLKKKKNFRREKTFSFTRPRFSEFFLPDLRKRSTIDERFSNGSIGVVSTDFHRISSKTFRWKMSHFFGVEKNQSFLFLFYQSAAFANAQRRRSETIEKNFDVVVRFVTVR